MSGVSYSAVGPVTKRVTKPVSRPGKAPKPKGGVKAPTNFTATAASSSQINLSWTASTTPNITGYSIERSADGVTGWAEVLTPDYDQISIENTGLTAETEYFYRIRAVKGSKVSAWSNVDSDTTEAGTASLLVGLHEWWEFAEASGSRVGSHAGTPATVAGASVSRVAGKVGWAVDFLNQGFLRVTEAAAPWIELSGHTAVTFAYWLYVDTWNGNSGVFGRWDSGNSFLNWTAIAGASNKLQWGPSAANFVVRSGLTTGSWVHFIHTYNPDTDLLATYVNNDAGATAAWSGPWPASTADLTIGKYTPSGGAFLDAKISEFAVWGRELTPTERAVLFNSGAGVAYPG